MLTNLIYISIAAILIFVLYLAVKAITRGVEAKSDLKQEKDDEINELRRKLGMGVTPTTTVPVAADISFDEGHTSHEVSFDTTDKDTISEIRV